ncbi:hypothetical protein [Thiomicrorhabdus cannonii]|uniref:hypothetical protein n=1 Tax=Thiomicrorhabdus cannonii TaxID=2748011 RepID=UPI0015BFF2F0|nr:hypothetical protein [Thiomicrorhabdus cannonii]
MNLDTPIPPGEVSLEFLAYRWNIPIHLAPESFCQYIHYGLKVSAFFEDFAINEEVIRHEVPSGGRYYFGVNTKDLDCLFNYETLMWESQLLGDDYSDDHKKFANLISLPQYWNDRAVRILDCKPAQDKDGNYGLSVSRIGIFIQPPHQIEDYGPPDHIHEFVIVEPETTDRLIPSSENEAIYYKVKNTFYPIKKLFVSESKLLEFEKWYFNLDHCHNDDTHETAITIHDLYPSIPTTQTDGVAYIVPILDKFIHDNQAEPKPSQLWRYLVDHIQKTGDFKIAGKGKDESIMHFGSARQYTKKNLDDAIRRWKKPK